MQIKKFEQYNKDLTILDDFLNNSYSKINETDQNSIKKIIKSISKDLNINLKFISTFGFAISGLYPIVEGLMKNMDITSIEITPRSIVMISLSAIAVIYLEEKDSKLNGEERLEMERETKSLLMELKLSGIGNGIVKKISESIKSIKNILNIILKHLGKAIESIIDMFSYTSLLIPVLNSVTYIITKYKFNIDDLIYNLSGISMGLVTIAVKQGVSEILKKLNISDSSKKEIINDIDKNYDQIDTDKNIDS